MSQTIHTVAGPVPPDQLGITLPHEHLLWDQRCYWPGDPEELSVREKLHQPVTLANRNYVWYHAHWVLDDILQFSVDLAIEEAMLYKRAGGATIVDVSSQGLGRDPAALLAIARATGLNLVMGSAWYNSGAYPPEFDAMSEDDLAAAIVKDFDVGAQGTWIKPGVIGEIAVNDLANPREVKMLRAAARAQARLGAPLYIHPPMPECKGLGLLDIVAEEGADVRRVVLCHSDPTVAYPDYHEALARRGAYIEYDQFGLEFPLPSMGIYLPQDIARIRAIKEQSRRGQLEHVLMSQDVCFKICLVKYGGGGYAHILSDLLPYFRIEGVTDAELQTIMIHNPARLLAW